MPQKRVFQSFAVPDMRLGPGPVPPCGAAMTCARPLCALYDEVEGKGLLFESVNIKNDQCLLVFIIRGV